MDFARHFYELKRQGYIDFDTNQGSIRFTDKARLRVVENRVKELASDQVYRFLSFDIPEEMRYERDTFRYLIKKAGFKQIQKSLWVIDKDVTDYIELLTYKLGIEKYVVYIVTSQSDIDGLLKNLFK